MWSDSFACGLAADLQADLPVPRAAKIPIEMGIVEPASYAGFADEATRVDSGDAIEVAQRARLCAAGARDLYVAQTDDGQAIYCQWLFAPGGEGPLHGVTPNQFPTLAPGDTLVEGAYTFVRYRKLGAMAVGMHQLLVAARETGARRCLTYVSVDNVPSLRGCANVGFTLDHTRVTRQRFGRRSVSFRPPTAAEQAAYDAAVAPRG